MKTYSKLPIPEDTAWDRSTLYGRLHWRIRDFITSCHNLIKWFPTIWNDRDWDDSFILKILQKKINVKLQKDVIHYLGLKKGMEMKMGNVYMKNEDGN